MLYNLIPRVVHWAQEMRDHRCQLLSLPRPGGRPPGGPGWYAWDAAWPCSPSWAWGSTPSPCTSLSAGAGALHQRPGLLDHHRTQPVRHAVHGHGGRPVPPLWPAAGDRVRAGLFRILLLSVRRSPQLSLLLRRRSVLRAGLRLRGDGPPHPGDLPVVSGPAGLRPGSDGRRNGHLHHPGPSPAHRSHPKRRPAFRLLGGGFVRPGPHPPGPAAYPGPAGGCGAGPYTTGATSVKAAPQESSQTRLPPALWWAAVAAAFFTGGPCGPGFSHLSVLYTAEGYPAARWPC